MRIAMNIGGEVLGNPCAPPEIVAEPRRAEAEGFDPDAGIRRTRALLARLGPVR